MKPSILIYLSISVCLRVSSTRALIIRRGRSLSVLGISRRQAGRETGRELRREMEKRIAIYSVGMDLLEKL